MLRVDLGPGSVQKPLPFWEQWFYVGYLVSYVVQVWVKRSLGGIHWP